MKNTYSIKNNNLQFSSELKLFSLNEQNKFKIDEIANLDDTGSVRDINGDGITDIIIGDIGVLNGTGQSYVIFGSRNLFAPVVFLKDLNGTNGFKIDGISPGDYSGGPLSSGDINGDGVTDIIIGAFSAFNETGQSYVVFGSRNSFASEIFLKNLNGANGFKIDGINPHDWSGVSLSSGDINGDRITDIIIGASTALNGAGQVYIVFGSRSSFSSTILLEDLDGINGFKINGINPGARSGQSLSSGDINGDGITDVIIGAPSALNSTGQTYIVFGHRNSFLPEISLKSLNGTNGFKIDGIKQGDYSGFGLSSGDINGDGITDVIIGAPFALNNTGQSYLVFGSRSIFPSTIFLNDKNGFKIDGINCDDRSGFVLSSGDINGDGIADVIIGAPGALNDAGQIYVVFGSKTTFSLEILLRELNGTNGFKIDGINQNDESGWALSSGDINADGIMDIIIDTLGDVERYVVFGSKNPFSAEISLKELNGINGFKIAGVSDTPGEVFSSEI